MTQTKKIKMCVNAADKRGVIDRNVYGNFSEHLGRCIYEGVFVGKDSSIPNTDGIRNDAIEALKALQLPVLRWPGGCFADEYHWKDGIGPQSERRKMINTHWGGVTEDNSFGTHEFFRLCELVGCEPYVTGNVGSGTVQEMNEWVEYMTSDAISPMTELRAKNGRSEPWRLKYLAVGNENWGCGGTMSAEHYFDEYRRYQTYCRNYGQNRLYKIACGFNEHWTEVLMRDVPHHTFDAMSLHYYCGANPTPEQKAKGYSSAATGFGEQEYYWILGEGAGFERFLRRHECIMDRYDPEKKIAIAVDEWGSWYAVEAGTNPGFLYQQNSMRDAMLAAIFFDAFNRHSDRVKMANIAQLANVLQAVILTEGAKLIKTPTYHAFALYRCHMDAQTVYSWDDSDTVGDNGLRRITQSASFKDGTLSITASNLGLDAECEIECDISGFTPSGYTAEILTGGFNEYNDFDAPERVTPSDGAAYVRLDSSGLHLVLPPCSTLAVTLK